MTSQRRRGVETLELILCMPILFIATLAIFEFMMIAIVQQTIVLAAAEGARATSNGATTDQAAQRVLDFLEVHQITFDPNDGVGVTGNARVRIEMGPLNETRGNSSIVCDPEGPALLDADESRVTVCVEVTDGNKPIPDGLGTLGFSLIGRHLRASSLIKCQ